MKELSTFNKKTTRESNLSTLLAAFITLLIVTSSTSARADGGDTFVSDNLQYKINGNGKTVTLLRYEGNEPSGSVTIPTTATNGGNEYRVTSIGDYAFYKCTGLTSVTIPEGVTSIRNYAFGDCENLTSVTIPESVTSIGNQVFYECTSLTSVTIPKGVTSIGNQVFYKCTSLTSVTIPEGVTNFGEFAFYGCTSLTSVTIPESVTSIGNGAFNYCTSLTSVTIPEKVTAIGYDAFSMVKHIINKSKCTDADHWGAIAENGIVDEDFVYQDDKKTKLLVYIGKGGKVTIPESVTSIGKKAFYYCTSLTSVTIPESVTSIEYDAYYNCTNIDNVYLYANPDNFAWNEEGKDDFKKSGETKCHVLAEYYDKYVQNYAGVNVTFEKL